MFGHFPPLFCGIYLTKPMPNASNSRQRKIWALKASEIHWLFFFFLINFNPLLRKLGTSMVIFLTSNYQSKWKIILIKGKRHTVKKSQFSSNVGFRIRSPTSPKKEQREKHFTKSNKLLKMVLVDQSESWTKEDESIQIFKLLSRMI